MNGRSGVAVPVEGSGRDLFVGAGVARGPAAPARVARPRSSAGRVTPQPTGPGRIGSRSGRHAPARPMPVRRSGASTCVHGRPVAGRMRAVPTCDARGSAGWRGVAALAIAGLAAAVAVFGLGALADVMAQVRVPDATAPVVVRADETLPQLAHRVAPSAQPSAVVRRIVELNDLGSPSVQPGQVLVSPIG